MKDEIKKTSLELEAEAYFNERNNKINIGNEYKKCKLVEVNAEMGITNRTPMVVLTYLLPEQNSLIEDRFYFSSKSTRVGIQRIDDTYYNLTGSRIEDTTVFRSISRIVEKMKEIIGAESYIKEYYNSKGYLSYQLLPRENSVTTTYDYWDYDKELEEISQEEIPINEYKTIKIPDVSEEAVDLSKLDEVVE